MPALIPCAVIVDTRNVHGQGKGLFGTERRPSASTIREALKPYGFDAVDIYAGVATQSVKKNTSAQVQQAVQHNTDYAKKLRADGVTVLEGRIAERAKMEEKQVDVLLALQVAELVDQMTQLGTTFRHIIVLSEDMDLIPAYAYAARRGIEVYAAAADTLHVRPQQVKWLLLHETAMSSLVGPPMYAASVHDVRSYMAATATRTLNLQGPINWKSFYDQPAGRVRLYNGRGVEGTWTSPHPVKRGDRIQLHPSHVDIRGRFPTLRLEQNTPTPAVLPDFTTGAVTGWVNQTRMKVALASGGSATLDVGPGAALTGDQVVVHTPSSPSASRTFVGPVTKWAAPNGWTGNRDQFAVVTSLGPRADRLLATTDGGDKILVRSDTLKHATVGSRLLVVPTGIDQKTGLPEVVPLSCCLP